MTDIHCHDAEIGPRYPHVPEWINPPRGVTHSYAGSGVSKGGGGFRWTPCIVCKLRQGHRVHGIPWRTCSWCGSIHPEDLLSRGEPDMMKSVSVGGRHLVDVPNVEWAHMKYGWPHKLYVDWGTGLHAKFYSRHLADAPALIAPFNERFGYLGVRFGVDDRGLFYRIGLAS